MIATLCNQDSNAYVRHVAALMPTGMPLVKLNPSLFVFE
jgi:hypothetical protein